MYTALQDFFSRSYIAQGTASSLQQQCLLLFTIFVGSMHSLFWVKFLHTVDAEISFGIIFVILTSVSGYLHLAVWRKGGEMLYTFIPHFLLNLFPLFWTGCSILPYLVR